MHSATLVLRDTDMNRRDYLKTLCAGVVASPGVSAGTQPKARFRPAICAYSFRKQLEDKSMTYADVVRMAAETGADGVDLTSSGFPTQRIRPCFP